MLRTHAKNEKQAASRVWSFIKTSFPRRAVAMDRSSAFHKSHGGIPFQLRSRLPKAGDENSYYHKSNHRHRDHVIWVLRVRRRGPNSRKHSVNGGHRYVRGPVESDRWCETLAGVDKQNRDQQAETHDPDSKAGRLMKIMQKGAVIKRKMPYFPNHAQNQR
jgi:uncharacterized alpha-E superfamily protein